MGRTDAEVFLICLLDKLSRFESLFQRHYDIIKQWNRNSGMKLSLWIQSYLKPAHL